MMNEQIYFSIVCLELMTTMYIEKLAYTVDLRSHFIS